MNKNFTLKFSIRVILFFLLSLSALSAFAQPDYYFTKPVLESGTDLAEGAVYRFADVRPGVDALVEVKKFHGGVTLWSIDESWTGFDEAFQPFIHCPPGTDGYVEFEINFVQAGTTNLVKQTEVPITPVDIDGGLYNDLFEQDQIKVENGYVDYDLLGAKLDLKVQGGGWFRAKDKTGVALAGIDTTDKQAMFTVVNANVDQVRIKMGAANSDSYSDDVRYRSVYFKKFAYTSAYSLLSASSLKNFNGYAKTNQVNLQWTLTASNQLKTIVVEKSTSSNGFEAIAAIEGSEVNTYNYTDNAPTAVNYYRLKMVSFNGKVEYSNVLVFKTSVSAKESFKVYPTVVSENATVSVAAATKEQTSVQLVDLSGRSVYQQAVTLQAGNNTFTIDGLNSLPKGTYVAVLKTGTVLNTQKIIKQ
jgi:Secretion system C-terminal sorting domain